MAVDQALLAAVRRHLLSMSDVEEKAMFGGAGFMWRGNLLLGVMGDELLVRVSKETGASLLGEDGAHPMVMGGRTSQGWILVPAPSDDPDRLLTKWLARAVSYAETLPAK